MLILFNKPFNVLSQFTDKSISDSRKTLSEFIPIKAVYPAGRLDRDSEGLLLLTDDGKLQHKIAHPDHKQEKGYWVQVDGAIDQNSIEQLIKGVQLKDGLTKSARAKIISEPKIWDRNPPIRVRKEIPTTWIELFIKEGKNRQVRRMTAAVGFPTLRLIRFKIGQWDIFETTNQSIIKPGEYILKKADLYG